MYVFIYLFNFDTFYPHRVLSVALVIIKTQHILTLKKYICVFYCSIFSFRLCAVEDLLKAPISMTVSSKQFTQNSTSLVIIIIILEEIFRALASCFFFFFKYKGRFI